jgi:hypothetical protein
MVAAVALACVCVIGITEMSHTMMKRQGATTAAEAFASALAAGRNIEAVVIRYDIAEYEITREGSVVTVRVERNGVAAEASATDHRRTLEDGS